MAETQRDVLDLLFSSRETSAQPSVGELLTEATLWHAIQIAEKFVKCATLCSFRALVWGEINPSSMPEVTRLLLLVGPLSVSRSVASRGKGGGRTQRFVMLC